MKNKDIIIVKKIIEYCIQINEALDMFNNDFFMFKSVSVFRMHAVCVSYKSESCVS